MPKKWLLVLIFLALAGGSVFSDDENTETVLPKNTITVDPSLAFSTFVAWGILGDYFFGTALQYERQIVDSASAALRLEYRGMSISSSDGGRTDLMGFSVEGHGRYYPERGVFFLDGMLGYANFTFIDSTVYSISHYFKLGGKLGWRIDFGKPGGLVLEPAFGYYWAIGKTNNLFETTDEQFGYFYELLNRYYDYLIKGYFVAGPQFGLSLGYRF